MSTQLANFINNEWNFPKTETLEVRNPATAELLAVVAEVLCQLEPQDLIQIVPQQTLQVH